MGEGRGRAEPASTMFATLGPVRERLSVTVQRCSVHGGQEGRGWVSISPSRVCLQ